MLDEPSENSLEEPESVVLKLSSRTSSAMLFIVLKPSPKDTPVANPAETVAEI